MSDDAQRKHQPKRDIFRALALVAAALLAFLDLTWAILLAIALLILVVAELSLGVVLRRPVRTAGTRSAGRQLHQ